ncbi:MAG: ABC transporter permease subunit [Gemmatimonadales bacterium]|nr:ABC transporter permease subunit [Gemmatimonadales bacterium]NIN13355.1 ABC transporter permease subunit [Gemmatimonadales bacterium]NIN51358.1 ABC transporter permease subunit [Gemmatimonadales bacterium]NIP08822.1 ABC transporter permease subunit [Gemmatimonadales bacterium]NIQ99816.1 ABC transporter permease subunit [Gemmatimonadales bacterium]
MTKRPRGVLLTLLLVWAVVYPVSLVMLDSVHGRAGWTLQHLQAFVREPTEWIALWNSVWIAVASVVLAGIVGVPLGFLFERLRFPGRRILGALVALPAVLPPLVGVIAFLFLYGESGFVPRAIVTVFRLDESPWRLQGAGAVLLVHAYSMYVYFYLFTRAGLAKIDSSMIEAAHSLGCGTLATFRRVTLPLLRPQLAAAALLTFMTALGSFSAPYIYNFRTMSVQIVTTKLFGNMQMAVVETTALAVVALAGLMLLKGRAGARSVVALGKGTAPSARTLSQPVARWGAAVLGWVFGIVLLLPHLTLVVMSLVPLGTWTTQLVPPSYTLANFGALLTEPERLRPLVNSLWMAAAATLGALATALWAGRLVVQRRASLRSAIETLVSVPWAVPGTVLAIALATAFSVNAPWVGRWVFLGTALILPLAYLVRNIPIAAGSVLAGFRQLDPSLDEAAASLGASRWRTLRLVTIPLLRPAILAGGALAFATALGDFVTSIVLYTFETRPISIEILAALRAFDVGTAAAYGVVLMLISAGAMVVGTRR